MDFFDSVANEIDNHFMFLEAPDLLAGTPTGAAGFFAGDRRSERGNLGDITGITKFTPKFVSSTPSRKVIWRLYSNYGTWYQELKTNGSELHLNLLAGVPGLYSLTAQSLDTNQILTQLGMGVVSVPRFFIVRVDQSFGDAVKATGLNRDNILRRTRTIFNHTLKYANVRAIWETTPFNQKLPDHFSAGFLPDANTLISGVYPTGPSSPSFDLRAFVFTLAIRGKASTDTSLFNGASLYVEDTKLPSQSTVAVALAEIHQLRTAIPDGQSRKEEFARFEEEVIARYLGLELARSALTKIGVPNVSASGDEATDLMRTDLVTNNRPETLENVLGLARLLIPSSVNSFGLYFDWVLYQADQLSLPYEYEPQDEHEPQVPDAPLTPLNILAATTAPETLDAIERLALLPPSSLGLPIPDARVVKKRTKLREDGPGYKSTSVELTQATPLFVLQQNTDGKFTEVRVVSTQQTGWLPTKDIGTFFRDDVGLRSAALKPEKLIDESGLSGVQKKLARTYNRLGGLMLLLAEQTSIELAIVLAVFHVESGGKAHTVDQAIIRFENHKLWDLWVKVAERARGYPGPANIRGPFSILWPGGQLWSNVVRDQKKNARKENVHYVTDSVKTLQAILSVNMVFRKKSIGYLILLKDLLSKT